MPRSRRGGRDTTAGAEAPHAEKGYFFIQDLGDKEFDYGLKDPSTDPPVGQFELLARLRSLYGWCADYVGDEGYRGFLERLRAAFFMGGVQEPINLREANRLMNEIEKDLLLNANRLLKRTADRAAVWHLGLVLVFFICYLIMGQLSYPATLAVKNYFLIAVAAVAALAVRTRARTPVTSLANYREQAESYERPLIPALLGAVLVVSVTICIQNRLVTLTVIGQTINIQDSPSTALALGFILGLANVRLLAWAFQQVERVLPRRGGRANRD